MNAPPEHEYLGSVRVVATLLLATFERNGWEMTRGHFQTICNRMKVAAPMMQAIFELDFNLCVERRSHKKMPTDVFVIGKVDG